MATVVNMSRGVFTINGVQHTVNSNAVSAELGDIVFPHVKSQSHTVVFLDTPQLYTTVATNNTGVVATTYMFSDTLDTNLTYTAGTFQMDGAAVTPVISGQNISYTMPSAFAAGASHTFTFQCKRKA